MTLNNERPEVMLSVRDWLLLVGLAVSIVGPLFTAAVVNYSRLTAIEVRMQGFEDRVNRVETARVPRLRTREPVDVD